MRRQLLVLAAASAVALSASGVQACDWHKNNVTAGVSSPHEGVTMSTHDDSLPPLTAEEAKPAEAAATPDCPEGQKDCAAGTE